MAGRVFREGATIDWVERDRWGRTRRALRWGRVRCCWYYWTERLDKIRKSDEHDII